MDHAAEEAADWSWATVLVIEDDDISRHIMCGMVRSFGVGRVVEAVDGIDGLEKLAADPPDLVITDIQMPRMDGIEVCRHIRHTPAHADIPILVQTALAETASHLECFAAGASDVLTKPLRKAELRARMRVHLENRRLVFSLRKANRRIMQEIEGARAMQSALMPRRRRLDTVRHKYGVWVEGVVEPSFSIGGDIWGVVDLDDDSFGLYSADFCGHGVMAALNTFRLHAILSEGNPPGRDPAAFLAALNETLTGLLGRGHYTTFFYAVINTRRGEITWSGAGAPFPILLSDDSWNFLDTVGTPLGLDRNAAYRNATLPFPPGSALLVYSDGMSDAQDHTGHTLGEQSILDFVMADMVHPLAVDLDGILARFRAKAVPPLADDLTVIWLRHDRFGAGAAHPPSMARMGVDEAVAAPWCRRWTMAACAETSAATLRLVADLSDAAALAAALADGRGAVEAACAPFPLDDDTCRALGDGAVLVAQTTRSAYRNPPSTALCDLLVARGWIGNDHRDDVWLVMQEAVSNAVIHGNLGLDNPPSGSRRTRDYWAGLRARLDDPALSGRAVVVTVRRRAGGVDIAVGDQGQGFAAVARTTSPCSGRGLGLIRDLATELRWEDGGRRIVIGMVF